MHIELKWNRNSEKLKFLTIFFYWTFVTVSETFTGILNRENVN